MKRLIIFLMIAVPLLTFSQEEKSDKKLTREEKKELRKRKEAAAEAKIRALVTNAEWVLEVTALMDKSNDHSFLNTSNNFVAMRKDVGVIQINLPNTRGWNGLGGTTLKGKVDNYEVKDSKKEIYATGTISTNQGAFTFRLYPGIHSTRIVLSGSFNDTVTLIGNLLSPDETVLLEGINIY